MFLRRLQTGFMHWGLIYEHFFSARLEHKYVYSYMSQYKGSAVASRHLTDQQVKGMRRKFIVVLFSCKLCL